jgi:nucleoside-diphosphate-sugar epimerase
MEGDNEKPIVTITGITGYIGSRVCHEFLLDGGYQVRGTVRNKSNMEKLNPLKEAYGEELFSKIDLREADLTNDESMTAAMEGTHYIVHTASPVPGQKGGVKEADVVGPAVQGTMSALKAARANKVKRIVITSSIAAIWRTKDIDKLNFGPDDWSDVTIADPYVKSKTMAEKAAWDFQKDLPEDEKFELVTVLPGFVFGKTYVPGVGTTIGWAE